MGLKNLNDKWEFEIKFTWWALSSSALSLRNAASFCFCKALLFSTTSVAVLGRN